MWHVNVLRRCMSTNASFYPQTLRDSWAGYRILARHPLPSKEHRYLPASMLPFRSPLPYWFQTFLGGLILSWKLLGFSLWDQGNVTMCFLVWVLFCFSSGIFHLLSVWKFISVSFRWTLGIISLLLSIFSGLFLWNLQLVVRPGWVP